jgi:hypothetical protein
VLLSENYIAHFLVWRRELVNQVGGFRSRYDVTQDYDLTLQVSRDNREHRPSSADSLSLASVGPVNCQFILAKALRGTCGAPGPRGSY